jgi:hypothetical protein
MQKRCAVDPQRRCGEFVCWMVNELESRYNYTHVHDIEMMCRLSLSSFHWSMAQPYSWILLIMYTLTGESGG